MPFKLSKFLKFSLFLFILTIIFAIFFGTWFVFSENSTQAAEEEADSEPPAIYEVKISDVNGTSSRITWKTNEKSDGIINYGLDKNYGIVRESNFDKTEHELLVPNLEEGRTYYFRITSSDLSGNQGISSDYLFVTKIMKDAEPENEEEEKSQEEAPQQGMGKGTVGEQGEGSGEGDSGVAGQGQGEGEAGAPGSGQGEGDVGIEGLGGGLEQLAQTEEGRQIIDDLTTIITNVSGSSEAQKLVAERLNDMASGPFEAPIIIEGYPEIVDVGADFVIIRWLTTVEANTIVALVEDRSFNESAANPYSWSEGDPNSFVSVHELTINGLRPATKYHYQAQSQGRVGPVVKSPDRQFITKSILPQIYNLNIDKVEENSATFAWSTNVPCSSVIEYTNLETNDTRSEGSPNFVTRHSIQLTSLAFDTPYAAVVRVQNEQGEQTQSPPMSFTTVKDELPPVISKLTTESTLYPGAETKIQTIISWDTDESSICQFFYHQGVLQGDQQPESFPPETGYVTKHIQVVTAFQPATVYKFWIKCQDRTKNESKSEDFTMLTPQKEQSILDLIISNFEGTFGWMKNMVPKK